MKSTNKIIAVASVAASMLSAAHADLINLSTGLDSAGNVWTLGSQQDANWIISGANNYQGAPNAYTVFPNDADWYGGWVANSATSTWIAGAANNSNNGAFTATRSFTLAASQLSGAVFSGSLFTLDDAGQVLLNGNVEATLGGGNWGGLQTLTLNPAHLVVGVNTLQLKITESDNYLEGVRLEGNLRVASVPEPTSLAAVALGLVAVARRRRS